MACHDCKSVMLCERSQQAGWFGFSLTGELIRQLANFTFQVKNANDRIFNRRSRACPQLTPWEAPPTPHRC